MELKEMMLMSGMYYEAQPDWSDIDWMHGLHGLMSRDLAAKANLRNSLPGKISRKWISRKAGNG